MGRLLFLLGLALVVAGLFLEFGPRVPVLSRLGRLPGDFRIQRPGFTFYFPLATSVLLSIALTLVLALFRKK